MLAPCSRLHHQTGSHVTVIEITTGAVLVVLLCSARKEYMPPASQHAQKAVVKAQCLLPSKLQDVKCSLFVSCFSSHGLAEGLRCRQVHGMWMDARSPCCWVSGMLHSAGLSSTVPLCLDKSEEAVVHVPSNFELQTPICLFWELPACAKAEPDGASGLFSCSGTVQMARSLSCLLAFPARPMTAPDMSRQAGRPL